LRNVDGDLVAKDLRPHVIECRAGETIGVALTSINGGEDVSCGCEPKFLDVDLRVLARSDD
jgi:hypothetical protein